MTERRTKIRTRRWDWYKNTVGGDLIEFDSSTNSKKRFYVQDFLECSTCGSKKSAKYQLSKENYKDIL